MAVTSIFLSHYPIRIINPSISATSKLKYLLLLKLYSKGGQNTPLFFTTKTVQDNSIFKVFKGFKGFRFSHVFLPLSRVWAEGGEGGYNQMKSCTVYIKGFAMKFLIFILISWEHFYLIAKRKPNQSTQIKSNVNLYSESAEDLDQGGGGGSCPHSLL